MNWNTFIQTESKGQFEGFDTELPRRQRVKSPTVSASAGISPATRFSFKKFPPVFRFPLTRWGGLTVINDRYGNEPPPKPDKPASEPNQSSGGSAPSGTTPTTDDAAPQGSEYIRWVQSTLNHILGLQLPLSGLMDIETRSAIQSFQRQKGLPADGIIGPDTEQALQAARRAGASVKSNEFETFNFKGFEQEWQGEANGDFISWIRQAAIRSSLRNGNEQLAVRFAIMSGITDENKLTDLVFFSRHPERQEKRLQRHEQQLILEWLNIRNQLVRPMLRASTIQGNPATATQPQAATQSSSTTSGVEAAGVTTGIIPCVLGLQAQGRSISFVVRYLRDLKRSEVTALQNNGLRLVSCYELTSSTGARPSNIAYYTRAQGRHDGRLGFTQAQAVGQTSDTPIYFAVDTDPSLRQRQAILEYFHGIQEGYNQYLADMLAQNKQAVPYAVGVYGSGCVLGWCQAQGIASWFWQAFAPGWCNNRKIWPGANIHTSGSDQPTRCGWRLGRLEGWGNEGSW